MSRTLARVLRGAGWGLVGFGGLVLLYVVYALFFTGMATRQAQAALRDQWDLRRSDAAAVAQPLPGDAIAMLEFARPGSSQRPVQDGPLFVVEGTGVEELKKGPGHYQGTALPGESGNFAVAGHRTTYSNPFFKLDELRVGDEVHVVDPRGTRWVYEVVRQVVVAPDATEVIAPDPLGNGRPTLTLTTCHPRFSDAQRLVVHAELEPMG